MVKNRCNELQKLENQLGWAITGNFRTTNLGVVMTEPGLRPAERKPRAGYPRETRPRPYLAATQPWGNTAMGQRMVHFSEYSGRVEEIYLLEDRPTELVASISIADAE